MRRLWTMYKRLAITQGIGAGKRDLLVAHAAFYAGARGVLKVLVHLLEHGVETGIIRQLPGGEFIEETRPVDEETLAVLTTRSEVPALPSGEPTDADVPPPGMRGTIGKVRERLYKTVTESVPLPSARNGHGNGHGNGHAVEANGHDRAAISAPEGSGAGRTDEQDS